MQDCQHSEYWSKVNIGIFAVENVFRIIVNILNARYVDSILFG